jgi:hypothetical protein
MEVSRLCSSVNVGWESRHCYRSLGAMAWERNPFLSSRLGRAVDHATAPIFLLQAKNDYSLGPSHALAKEANRKNKDFQSKLYPAFGRTNQDALRVLFHCHGCLGKRCAGISQPADGEARIEAAVRGYFVTLAAAITVRLARNPGHRPCRSFSRPAVSHRLIRCSRHVRHLGGRRSCLVWATATEAGRMRVAMKLVLASFRWCTVHLWLKR